MPRTRVPGSVPFLLRGADLLFHDVQRGFELRELLHDIVPVAFLAFSVQIIEHTRDVLCLTLDPLTLPALRPSAVSRFRQLREDRPSFSTQ